MQKVFIVHYAEVGLKGKNRSFFENRLVRNIQASARRYGIRGCPTDLRQDSGEVGGKFGYPRDSTTLGHSHGIAHFELCRVTEQNMEAIKNGALEWIQGREFQTLKVETKRANKHFPLTSPEISAEVGGYLLKHTGAKADMHRPDLLCWIEIVEKSAYIYTDKIRGIGGLPVSVSGKVLVMLSAASTRPWRRGA